MKKYWNCVIIKNWSEKEKRNEDKKLIVVVTGWCQHLCLKWYKNHYFDEFSRKIQLILK